MLHMTALVCVLETVKTQFPIDSTMRFMQQGLFIFNSAVAFKCACLNCLLYISIYIYSMSGFVLLLLYYNFLKDIRSNLLLL